MMTADNNFAEALRRTQTSQTSRRPENEIME